MTTTLPDVARITYRQWCESRGWTYTTGLRWRARYDDFPEPIETIGVTHLYLESKLDKWKNKHPELGSGHRFGRPTPPSPDNDPDSPDG